MKRFFALQILLSLIFGCATPQTRQEAGRSYTSLDWEFAPRPEIYGFEILRADREEGPYQKITAEPIPAIDPKSGKQPVYHYRDENVQPGAVYYYSIEAIDLVRKRNERISPVLRMPVIPPGQPIAQTAK